MKPIHILIELIRLIDDNVDIDVNDTRDVHPLISAVIYLADECLCIDNNKPNILHLKNAGFDVYPAEQDSFGWLTGWIQLKKRDEERILFG
jgi:hypothetical protein